MIIDWNKDDTSQHQNYHSLSGVFNWLSGRAIALLLAVLLSLRQNFDVKMEARQNFLLKFVVQKCFGVILVAKPVFLTEFEAKPIFDVSLEAR